MTKYILMAAVLFLSVFNANADFSTLIKKDSEIPVKEHPSLFFSASDMPQLRKKANNAYFKAYTADLLTTADSFMRQNRRSFQFSENPNFQTITETLTMAYIITGDKKYSRRAIELVTAFVNEHYQKLPVNETGKFAGWIRGNSTTFILIPISFVYDTLYDQMTEQERFDIRKGLTYFCQLTYNMIGTAEYAFSFYKNYTAGETGALGIACMVLRHETDWPVDLWFDRALRYTLSWVNVAIKPDGIYPEGVSYLLYTVGNQMLFLNALSREQDIKYFDRTNFKNSLKWMIWSMLPWKTELDNFSDGGYNSSACNVPFIFQYEYPELGGYLTQQLFGNAPRYNRNPFALIFGSKPEVTNFDPDKAFGTNHLFKYGGMAAFRSGWSTQDVLMFIYATKYEYSAHSQADRGHFNLYGYGEKWLIDSGYGNDAKIVNSGTPSQAHSIVLIDGKGIAFDPSMRQSGTFADIDRYIANDKIGYVRVDQKDAYDFYNRYYHASRRIYNPVKKAFRNLLFVNKAETPPYALVYDDIDKDGKLHDYTYLLQLARGKKIISDNKQNVTLVPYAFSGTAISNIETGGYGDFKKPGYRLFKYLAGYTKFKVNVPEAGKYIMWTFGKEYPTFSSEIEIVLNGTKKGRAKPAFSIDFAWMLITKNRKKMHKPYIFDLKQGENIIEFTGVTQGYALLKGLLVKYSSDAEKNIPIGYNPKNISGVSFDAKNIIKKQDVKLEKITQTALSECQIKALWPQDGKITFDYYQPTKDAGHQRMKFNIKSIEPNFLFLLYPKKRNMVVPICNSKQFKDSIKTTIKWRNYQDVILINTGTATIKDQATGITTDGKFTFCRFNANGEIIRILSSGCTLLELSDKKLYSGQPNTVIYETGKVKTTKYLINRTSKKRTVVKMNKLKKVLLGAVTATAIVTSSQAAFPKAAWGRVDVDAEKAKIKIEPIKKELSKSVAFFHAKWRKDKQAFYLSSRVYFKNDVWRSIKLAFTPDADGKVKLLFLGAWRTEALRKEIGFPWFTYVNIKVNGKPISFDDKIWLLVKGAEFITVKGPDGKEIKCLKAKCHSPASYMIDVKKDQNVIVEFDVKLFK